MSNFEISDRQLTAECDTLAADIFAEVTADMAADETPDDLYDTMLDRAHEAADGHQWVIYTHSAIMLCAHCNIERGEEFLEDTGMPETVTFGALATAIAYGEIRARIEMELSNLIDAWEDTRPVAEESDDGESESK